MATRLRPCFPRLVFAASLFVTACSGSGSGASTGNEPDSGQGGGSTGTGVAGSGGSASLASGGSTGAAGMSGSGGNAGASAGASGSAGKASQGGTATGGTTHAGGTSATGGKTSMGGSAGGGGNTGVGGAGGGGKTGGTTGAAGATGAGGKGGTGGSTGAGGTGAAGSTGSGGGDFGFTFRPVTEKQLDYLCTLNTVGASTYVYARMDQTGTKSVGIATIPVYTVALAKMSVNGAVTDLANPRYDYGTGHNIDSLRFDYQGKTYEYYHSSLGFGYRPCQPMDCVNVYAPGGTTPSTDGCTAARAQPEVCVLIKADGTHDPLVDKFKKCPGDSNK